MTQKTPLYDHHVRAGGKLVDFGGWQLPVHYGSLVDEHNAVRSRAGVFDVSHMTIVDVTGSGASAYLARLLGNDIAQLQKTGAALYTCMLNHDGGIIDDLIVYSFGPEDFRLVVNAATREKDLAWMQQQTDGFDVDLREQSELAMLALQGPDAREIWQSMMPPEVALASNVLSRFQACRIGAWFIARTGYTGEDGYEIALPARLAGKLWEDLLASGVAPCGLGARDTLRLEAGMSLYGSDMDESQTPLTSGLGWTVAWQPAEREFIGRAALQAQREAGPPQQLIGLLLEGRGVLRGGQTLHVGEREVGVVTSGTHSPTLQQSIAFARVDADVVADQALDIEVQIRRNRLPVRRCKRTFVRDGQSQL